MDEARSAYANLGGLFRGRLEGQADTIPAPPYHVHAAGFIYALTELQPQSVHRLLPPELEPADTPTGTLGLFNAPNGFGIAPYTAFFVGIQVKGFDSTDGSPGVFMVTGYYSNRAGRVMHENYNIHLVDGQSRQWLEDGNVVGEAGPGKASVLRIVVRQPAVNGPTFSGVHNYLGRNARGGINLYEVSFTGQLPETELVSFELFDHASDVLREMHPVAMPYVFYVPSMGMTYSAPRTVIGPSDDPETLSPKPNTLLDVLSRLYRAAAIVDQKGMILYINDEASRLLGSSAPRPGTRLKGHEPAEQVALGRAIEQAVRHGPNRLAEPIALRRESAGAPLIVQAIPLQWEVSDGPVALLLFDDPMRPASAESMSTLQLLGLTPAESRLAALVGAGRSPREAAQAVGITEGTARSTLRAVFDKLDIRKQSELATIVARLEVQAPSLAR